MTAINTFRLGRRVYMVTDGAVTGDDGSFNARQVKVGLCPHLNCAMAARGRAGITSRLWPIVSNFASYELMKGSIVEQVHQIAGLIEKHNAFGDGRGHIFDLVIGGITKDNEADTFMVSTTERPGLPAFTMIDLGEMSLIPGNTALESFAADYVDPQNIARGCAEILEEQRKIHDPVPGVGGFAQLTTIEPNSISTRIIKRWNDEIGRPIKFIGARSSA
jgi:hypothetical protein